MNVALRQRLWDNIKALNNAGVTVVLTTHYLEEAEALCDQIAIINKGDVITAKTKAELLRLTEATRTIHFNLEKIPEFPLPDALNALGAKWHEGRLSIRFDPLISTAIDLLNEVKQAGFQVNDISTSEPDLEDVFIKLTEQ